MNPVWWLTRVVLPVGIPLAALVLSAALIALFSAATREEPEPRVTRVEVLTVEQTEAVARVYGTGLVVAARRLPLIAEVAGKVVYVSEELMPGGRFAAGDVVLRVDDTPYRATLDGQSALLAQAELDVQREEEARGTADYDASAHTTAVAQRDLILASVTRAELKLAGTTLRAPFDGVLVDEGVELGQSLGPGTPVATLVGSANAWVYVSIPVEELAVLAIPDRAGAAGSEGVVRQRLSDGALIERPARVLRLVGELDPATRTARVLVEIAEPLSGALPLLPGAHVEVVLEGTPMEGAFVLPRVAVHDGGVVWVVAEGDVLERREIVTAWRDRETIIVASGLQRGDLVVTSPLSLPIEGMIVTTEGQ